MSPRNSLPGSGCSTLVTTARPMPTTRTRSRPLPSAPKPCGCCSLTVSSKHYGCSPTAAKHSPGVGSRTVDRLQALLAELLPGQAKRDITAGQAKAMLASVRPRDIAGKTRRRIAAEELAELIAVEAKIKKSTAELKTTVLSRGSHLMDLHGVGPVVAARVLADVGDVTRLADRNRFASWTGTAPLDASSGEQNRHRLSRAGNRRMNHMIHIAAISQIRLDTDGRVYYRRKRAEGKKPLEAIRCLKRRISDAIYRQLIQDAQRATAMDLGTGPGGHCRATKESGAVDLPLHNDTSDQPLPGPAEKTLRRTG
jgi:transposase